MSALGQFTTVPLNRRRAPRFRVSDPIAVVIGRGEGTLLDISLRGARVRHASSAGRGTHVRFAFEWRGRRFAATAIVMASRLVALDGPVYESRLHFAEVPHEFEPTLRDLIVAIEGAELRRAVENLRGLGSPIPDPPPPSTRFIRCRFFSPGRWDKKWTRDAAQPDSGFTVPATLSEFELAQLCRSYETAGEDGRLLLRKIAEAMAT